MKIVQSKFVDVWHATAQDVKLCVKVEFTSMMVKNSIIPASTVQGLWTGSQLAWLVATQIVSVSLHGIRLPL